MKPTKRPSKSTYTEQHAKSGLEALRGIASRRTLGPEFYDDPYDPLQKEYAGEDQQVDGRVDPAGQVPWKVLGQAGVLDDAGGAEEPEQHPCR